MPKAIREQIGKGPGDTIEVIVWRDEGKNRRSACSILKVDQEKKGCFQFSKSWVTPIARVLPLDYRSEKTRNTIEEIKESHWNARRE
jgi:bifunctional DNA-binding transcriptional regulator/antitoxin component of YhaV-PrlF toxin-antitoxin module